MFLRQQPSQVRNQYNVMTTVARIPPPPSQDYRQEFVRRALAWRDQKWSLSTGGQGRPSSYLLTLLVLKAHEDAMKRLGVFSTLSPDTMALQ